MSEINGYRSIVVASQSIMWLIGQLLKLCFAVDVRPRRRYMIEIGPPVRIPEPLDLEAGASWLRERTLDLHERARRRGEGTA